MNGAVNYRWSICLAAMSAIAACSISSVQGIAPATIFWRGLVAFAMVWAFQWSLLAAWDILGDETPTPQRAQVRQGGA